MILVWVFCVVAPAPFLCWFAAFSAGETQIWPGDLRVVAVLPGFCLFFLLHGSASWYEAKTFHTFCNFFNRFSHCQDRALERNRPQQRKKKCACHTSDIQHFFKHGRMSRSATPATEKDIGTCLKTFENNRFCSFPHRHGETTRKPKHEDETCWKLKTSTSCETSAHFHSL